MSRETKRFYTFPISRRALAAIHMSSCSPRNSVLKIARKWLTNRPSPELHTSDAEEGIGGGSTSDDVERRSRPVIGTQCVVPALLYAYGDRLQEVLSFGVADGRPAGEALFRRERSVTLDIDAVGLQACGLDLIAGPRRRITVAGGEVMRASFECAESCFTGAIVPACVRR
jgi:hypothetical protein